MKIVQPLRGGQITIPVDFRRELGIDQNTALQMVLLKGELRVKPIRIVETCSSWFKDLYELFGRVRKQSLSYSEKEINRQINQALKEIRKNRD